MLDPVKDCSNFTKDNLYHNKCLHSVYKARYNALIMLKTRGYYINNSLFLMDKKRFSILYTQYINEKKDSSILDIKIKNKGCFAKISWIKKLSDTNKAIKKYKEDLIKIRNKDDDGYFDNESPISLNDNLVIIVTQNINFELHDYFNNNKNIENDNISIFSLAQLQINILSHRLVPKHTLLTKNEKKLLESKYNITSLNLPKIIRFASLEDNVLGDPVARYLGGKTGDVFKIERFSNNCVSLFYRVIADISNSNSEKIDLTQTQKTFDTEYTYSDKYLGKAYYKTLHNNATYSGLSVSDFKNVLQYSIITQNKDILSALAYEFTSYYLLIYTLYQIKNNNIKNNGLNLSDMHLLKKILSSSKIDNVDTFIEINIKFIENNILRGVLDYLKWIVSYYYFNIELALNINNLDSVIENIINTTASPEIFYKEISKLFNLFMDENLKITLSLEYIHKVLIIPQLLSENFTIKNLKKSQQIFLENSSLPEKQKYLDFFLELNDDTLKLKSKDYLDKLLENQYDVTLLRAIDEKERYLFILFYYSLVNPQLYDNDIPIISDVFVYLREIIIPVKGKISSQLDISHKINILWGIIRNVLEKNSKYSHLLSITQLYNKWSNENIEKKTYTMYLLNSIIIVLYKDTDQFMQKTINILETGQTLDSMSDILSKNTDLYQTIINKIKASKTSKNLYINIDKDIFTNELKNIQIQKDSIIYILYKNFPYHKDKKFEF